VGVFPNGEIMHLRDRERRKYPHYTTADMHRWGGKTNKRHQNLPMRQVSEQAPPPGIEPGSFCATG